MFQLNRNFFKLSLIFSGVLASNLFCHNGGTPINDEYCFCPVGFHGLNCKGKICEKQQIENPPGSGNCTCYPGYAGDECDQVNQCWNGFSVSVENQGICDCSDENPQYTGLFFGALCDEFDCEHERLHCLPGTTKFNFTSFETSCQCKPPYGGKYCEIIQSCFHGGTPSDEIVEINPIWPPPVSVFGEFFSQTPVKAKRSTCICIPPFTGQFCEELVCKNGTIVKSSEYEFNNTGRYEC